MNYSLHKNMENDDDIFPPMGLSCPIFPNLAYTFSLISSNALLNNDTISIR